MRVSGMGAADTRSAASIRLPHPTHGWMTLRLIYIQTQSKPNQNPILLLSILSNTSLKVDLLDSSR